LTAWLLQGNCNAKGGQVQMKADIAEGHEYKRQKANTVPSEFLRNIASFGSENVIYGKRL
jgi:hypothetical protein